MAEPPEQQETHWRDLEGVRDLAAASASSAAVAALLAARHGLSISPSQVRADWNRQGWAPVVKAKGGAVKGKYYPRPNRRKGTRLVAPPLADAATITREEQWKRRAADLAEENRTLRRELEGRASLVEALKAEFAALPRIEVHAPAAQHTPHRPRTLLLCLSDVHVGQLFERQRGGGLGEYNLAVFEQRMDRIAAKVLAIAADLRATGPVDRLVMNFGGDLLDGADVYLGHAGEALGLAEQLRVGPDVMTQTLLRPLAADFAEIQVFAHAGNHGKPGGRKSPSDYVKGSLDVVFVDFMRAHAKGLDHITWHNSDTWFSYYTIYEHGFFAAHGDAFKAWNRIPFYGAIRYLANIQSMLHKPVDALIVGHHHNAAAFGVGWANVAMNGSVPGNSTLGTWLGLSGPPIQKLLLVSEDLPVATQYDLHLASRAEMLTVEPVRLDG